MATRTYANDTLQKGVSKADVFLLQWDQQPLENRSSNDGVRQLSSGRGVTMNLEPEVTKL